MAHSESKTTLQFCRYSSSRELAQEEKNRSADNSKYKSHTATHRTTWCKLCCKHAAIFPTSITFLPLYFSLSSKIYQKSPCQYPKINSDTSIAKYHRLCMCLVLHHRKLRFKDYNHKTIFHETSNKTLCFHSEEQPKYSAGQQSPRVHTHYFGKVAIKVF